MKREVRRVALIALCMGILGGILGAILAGGPATAGPGLGVGPNPWVLTETDDQAEGLRLNCAQGANGQCFIAYDYLNQPISGINRAGAALWFAGDNMIGYGSNDIFNYRFRVDPENATPPQNDCYGLSGIEGRVFIGAGQGANSGVYVCKNGPYALYWSKLS